MSDDHRNRNGTNVMLQTLLTGQQTIGEKVGKLGGRVEEMAGSLKEVRAGQVMVEVELQRCSERISGMEAVCRERKVFCDVLREQQTKRLARISAEVGTLEEDTGVHRIEELQRQAAARGEARALASAAQALRDRESDTSKLRERWLRVLKWAAGTLIAAVPVVVTLTQCG